MEKKFRLFQRKYLQKHGNMSMRAAKNIIILLLFNLLPLCFVQAQTGAALNFDGVDDFIQIPNSNAFSIIDQLNTAVTIEYWFKGSNPQSAVRFQNTESTDAIIAGGSNGKHIISNGSNTTSISMGNMSVITDGNWHHIAMVWEKNTVNGFRSYLDGVLVEQINTPNIILPEIRGDVTANLGCYFPTLYGRPTELMNGSLDEVRVWKIARSGCLIQQSMKCEVNPSEPGLLLYYRFNQGIAGGNNSAIVELDDISPTDYDGLFGNFIKNGTTSNFIAPGAVVSGTTCAALPSAGVSIAVTGGANPTCKGTSVTFTATPTNGGTNPQYQWKKNGFNVGTGSTYTDVASETGVFTCEMTVGSGICTALSKVSATTNLSFSNTVTVSVSNGANPTCSGSPVTFLATPINGGSTPQYQWKKNGTNVGTGVSYTDAGTTKGTITCTMTGSSGGCVASSVTSVPTKLNIVSLNLTTTAGNCGNNSALSLTGAHLSPQVQWKLNGTTVATSASPYSSNFSSVVISDVFALTSEISLANGLFISPAGDMYITYNQSVVKVVAGSTSGVTVAGGYGTGQFNGAKGVAVDAAGNIYVSDQFNHRVLKWSVGATSGVVVAGGNGKGNLANQLNAPDGIFVDEQGTLYVADYNNYRIMKWPSGATEGIQVATANQPRGVFVTPQGDIYVVDSKNFRIQKWSNGVATTVANFANGQEPVSISVDEAGNIYASADLNKVYRFSPGSTTGTLIAEIPGSSIFQYAFLGLDANNNIYVMYSEPGKDKIVKYEPKTYYAPTQSGTYTAFVNFGAGCASNPITINYSDIPPSVSISLTGGTNPTCPNSSVSFTAAASNAGTNPNFTWKKGNLVVGTGSTYTDAASASGYLTCEITAGTGTCPNLPTSAAASVFISVKPALNSTLETTNGTCLTNNKLVLRGVKSANQIEWKRNGVTIATNNKTVTTVAGGNGNGSAGNQLNSPSKIFVDNNGVVFIADPSNHRIQKWLSNATSGTTVAGGNGGGTAANQLYFPTSVYNHTNGDLYVMDYLNSRVQKWAVGATSGTTVAGASPAALPLGILSYQDMYIDPSNIRNIYLVDEEKIVLSNDINTGFIIAGDNGDGSAANQLDLALGIHVFGAQRDMYIADYTNNRVQKWPWGANSATTVAGTGIEGSSSNQLASPTDVFLTSDGTLYVAELGNNRVQKWLPNAIEGITVAGGNGAGSAANQLNAPIGIHVDAQGNIYVSDRNNHRVQKWADNIDSTFTLTQSGIYSAVITPLQGCPFTTNDIVIRPTINPSVTIIIESGINPTCLGSAVTFTASGIGAGTNPTYQWKKNGANVGTNDISYTDAGTTSGFITCTMTVGTNVCTSSNSAISNSLSLIVNSNLTTPSVSIAITSGSNPSCNGIVTFTATANNGGVPPSFQWKKDGINVGTGNTYTDVSRNDGLISCVMTVGAGVCPTSPSATSSSIALQILTPSPTTTNNALNFDGINDFVKINKCGGGTIFEGGNAITIEYWFRGSHLQSAVRMQDPSNNYIVSGWTGDNIANNPLHILSNSGGTSGIKIANDKASIYDGKWHHIAMTWKIGEKFTSYFDGNLVEQINASATSLPSFNIGAYLGTLNGTNEFINGTLDDIRVWTVERSQAQIQSNMSSCLLNNQIGLLMYYQFDYGSANGNNSNINKIANIVNANDLTGTLNNFNLTSTSSNWVKGKDCGITLSAKVFLEGAYNSATHKMRDDLRASNIIPTTEPYTALNNSSTNNFLHIGGGGNELTTPSVLAVTGDNAIVDWVFIELRSATNPTTVLYTRSALLQADGDVVDDGTLPVLFTNVSAGNYFISFKHRNHLKFRTQSTITLTGGLNTFDFTNNSISLLGSNPLILMETVATVPVYAMYSGDLNANGSIDATDRSDAWNSRNLTGYNINDCSLNGTVDATDRSNTWNNRNVSTSFQ